MKHRTALVFFMSLLLTACDKYEEHFLSGSFTQTKPGCHILYGLYNMQARLCYPSQIKIIEEAYLKSKSNKVIALALNDEKGAPITVWVSKSELQQIGTVTVNIREVKTTWGKLVDSVPYVLAITAIIAIYYFLTSKGFRLYSLGGVLGILTAIGVWLVSSLIVQEFTTGQSFWRAIHVLLFGPFLGWLAGTGVYSYFSNLVGKLCPKCSGTDIEEYGSSSYDYEDTETKTRRFTHFNKNGEETGYSEEKYEVPATFTRTIHLMRCKTCKHEWKLSS